MESKHKHVLLQVLGVSDAMKDIARTHQWQITHHVSHSASLHPICNIILCDLMHSAAVNGKWKPPIALCCSKKVAVGKIAIIHA